MWRILFFTLILFSSVAFAQLQEKPQAVKFDEFGKLSEKNWKTRLEKYQEKIYCSSPETYLVIVYAPKEITANNLGKKYLDYLVKLRCIDPPRITISFGGFRKNQLTELWIIPPPFNRHSN